MLLLHSAIQCVFQVRNRQMLYLKLRSRFHPVFCASVDGLQDNMTCLGQHENGSHTLRCVLKNHDIWAAFSIRMAAYQTYSPKEVSACHFISLWYQRGHCCAHLCQAQVMQSLKECFQPASPRNLDRAEEHSYDHLRCEGCDVLAGESR